MKLKIKKMHPMAVIPKYQTSGAIAFDLHAVLDNYDRADGVGCVPVSQHYHNNRSHIFRTGLAFEVPEGYGLFVFPRSGCGFNYDVQFSNGTGLIDQDYRGEVKVKLIALNPNKTLLVKHGDRIAQAVLMPIVKVEFDEVDELSDTERGEGGFGSTGV